MTILDTEQPSHEVRLALIGLADGCNDEGGGLEHTANIKRWVGCDDARAEELMVWLQDAGWVDVRFHKPIGRVAYFLTYQNTL